ncbi:MAG TPA: peptide-methionine (S)-S-oxide reductase MsrA [Nocardioides sp.]|uniref:peptide-methionine (S)-S-oxide reductase MsrA n=1 Tax=Nocardioides sp. TaxID=35761 RepID=UPI002E312166|nr:peptide-methionine (S)-S-oxide reductase MsrA [Nocardioides sp.]HEX3932277.1 peptide-methionine (S)-S-oxide reductase MsrA [Nocardioides sp.]
MSIFSRHKSTLPSAEEAISGRESRSFAVSDRHVVLDAPVITDEVPEGYEVAIFGLGCFWGAEEIYWQVPGVWSTSVGYAGGMTPNPTYDEVCSGRTGHTEAVRIVFDPQRVAYADLVKTFFEVHDPTQGMRQGNDVGTQYRSGIYTFSSEQKKAAEESKAMFGGALAAKRFGAVTTEVIDAPPFYFAEDYHQQYLAKNPMGYCGLGGTGVSCPIGTGVAAH